MSIPALQAGDPLRIVVEAYPGVLARHLIGRASYKTDDKKQQTGELRDWRRIMLGRILTGRIESLYGLRVEASKHLDAMLDDPSGDEIDSLLCAIQAAWAWSMKDRNYGTPAGADSRLEGWIADPIANPPDRERAARARPDSP